jgi:thiamine biosynthesis protein ThiI
MLLIRYNELGLKSPRVRSRFQKQMIQNIENKFLAAGLDCFIKYDWGRIYLQTNDLNSGIDILKRVFGLASVSPVVTTDDDLDTITNETIGIAKRILKPNNSFALRTRRTGNHDYTSMDLAKYVGREILNKLDNMNLKVNLSSPDKEIFIEVRKKNAYIFSESYSGPGGLPLGTQGKIISVFTNEKSYLATWLMMKRGCRTFPIFFNNNGENSKIKEQQFQSQIELLRPWAANLCLTIFDLDLSSDIDPIKSGLENKNFLRYIEETNVKGICFSFSFEDFKNIGTDLNSNLPIFHPLIGLDDQYIEKIEQIIKDSH